jgi:hypothetical protein
MNGLLGEHDHEQEKRPLPEALDAFAVAADAVKADAVAIGEMIAEFRGSVWWKFLTKPANVKDAMQPVEFGRVCAALERCACGIEMIQRDLSGLIHYPPFPDPQKEPTNG